MRVPPSSEKCPKAAYSVSETAIICGLSRSRFYDLVKAGVMPAPCYDTRTRRPLYPLELQEQCLHIRQTNTGLDGRYVIFNSRRAITPSPERLRNPQTKTQARQVDPSLLEVVDGLRALGNTAQEEHIQDAVAACYPGGLLGTEIETAIKTVFRHLRRSNTA